MNDHGLTLCRVATGWTTAKPQDCLGVPADCAPGRTPVRARRACDWTSSAGEQLRRRKGHAVKITTIGKGNIGGGLARLWERAGHDVTTLGSEGGDASEADVVLVAVPSGAIADALARVT